MFRRLALSAPDHAHPVECASTTEGLMSAEDRDAVLREVLALQKKDGGWCLPSFHHICGSRSERRDQCLHRSGRQRN